MHLGALGRRPLLSSFIVVALLCVLSVLFVDQPLARYYRESAAAETLTVFRYITDLGDATPYVIVLLLILAGCGIAGAFSLYEATFAAIGRITNACVLILLSLAVSGAIIHVIKFSMGRYRPQGLFESGLYDAAMFTAGYLNSSFPSGHSQVVGALAGSLVLIASRYTPVYIVFAALVGYSRVVTGDHYLSDVIFGLFVGAASAVLLKQRIYDRRGLPVAITRPRGRALASGPQAQSLGPAEARVASRRRRAEGGSKQAHLLETTVPLARDDNVVVKNDSHAFQRLLDESRHLDVGG